MFVRGALFAVGVEAMLEDEPAALVAEEPTALVES